MCRLPMHMQQGECTTGARIQTISASKDDNALGTKADTYPIWAKDRICTRTATQREATLGVDR